MSRPTYLAVAFLTCSLLACAAAQADALADPTVPPTSGRAVRAAPAEFRVEGILCHGGTLTAIVNDGLVQPGDRIGESLIRSVTLDGVAYSHGRGRTEHFAFAPKPVLASCPAAAGPGASGEEHFGVDAADAPARAVFEGLAEGTRYNILVSPEVNNRVSMTLKDVTLPQLLEAVRSLYGYDYRQVPAGFLILPAAVQMRIFHISYLDLERYGVSNTRISSGQVTQGDYNSQYTNAIAAPQTQSTAVVGNKDDKTTIDTSGTSVMTRDDSDFWGNLQADLRAMVAGTPGASVIVDPQSGVIVVRALPTQMREVSDYLRETEDTVTRQVILEAKVVEVDLDHAYQAGIDWAKVLQLGTSHYFIGQSSPPGGFDTNPLTQANVPVTVGPGNPISSLATNSLGGAFTLAADFTDFNAFIQLLSTEGHTHVLSSPRVATVDNQKAIIKAGTDQFYVTGVQSNTVTGTATSTSNNVILTPFFSGVALDVTPQISADGEVLLHIHPVVSVVTNQTVTLQVQGTTDVLPLAQSSVRESDSIVRARSGQVIVIGGLMQETVDKSEYKTPLLGDVPGVGRLFRSERDQKSKIELVILLRAVVTSGGAGAAWDAEPGAVMGQPSARTPR